MVFTKISTRFLFRIGSLVPLLPAPVPAAPDATAPMTATAALIPLPRIASWSGESVRWPGSWQLVDIQGSQDPRLRHALGRLVQRWQARTGPLTGAGNGGGVPAGYPPRISASEASKRPAVGPTLHLAISGIETSGWRQDESYRLKIGRAEVLIQAGSVVGAMRGLATLSQLLTRDADPSRSGWNLPEVEIEDAPRFPWRGLMIDVCRHWQPVEVIERTLDGMELVKLNVLHLHLTDDQGFRIESRTHPELTRAGSDGRYFTREQIRSIVEAAEERGIRVVPEFDLPGHATSWAVSHPELASAPGPYRIERRWGVFNPVLDPTKPELYALLADFFGEMATLFPDPFVHLGGDENNGVQWNANPAIQDFIHARGLGSNAGLQAYFNRRIADLLRGHGKRLVGWDEILHPDLPAGSVIQSWRGADGVVAASRAGFEVLRSNGYYLDLGQSAAEHYAQDPMPTGGELSGEEMDRVLGGEAAMWSEWVGADTIDTRIWPRAAAVAERLWSPSAVRDSADLYRRLDLISERLSEGGTRHRAQPAALAAHIAESIGAPRAAAAILELSTAFAPLRGYDRAKAQPHLDQTQPLTTFADLVVPDAPEPRRFAAEAARWRETKEPAAAAALGLQLAAWKNAALQVKTEAASERWADGANAATALNEACDLALAVLRGHPPSDAAVILHRLSAVHAATRLALLPALGKLLSLLPSSP